MGFGSLGAGELEQPQFFDEDYRRGYPSGITRGDARVGHYRYRRPTTAIRTSSKERVELIEKTIAWGSNEGRHWHTGLLAGIFDAEGSCSRGLLRISNANVLIVDQIQESLRELDVDHAFEGPNLIAVYNVRVVGGLPMRQRFFRLAGLPISRTLALEGASAQSSARLEIVSIEDLGETIDMIDISTGTGDFIANGVISHNCFARKTHEYLDLDAGKDFDSEIVVKVNVAEVLAKELARPGWGHQPVALGTNTDPYQRAEGRYRLMPGIIAALADSGTDFSVLTKGTLLRRDLPLIAEAASVVNVGLAMSIAIYDDELQQSVEPGTPSTTARLATVTAARELGLECEVFMMPILPYLTDTRAHLDDAFARIRAAGATSVVFGALHLRLGTKEWFFEWLERAHPDLVDRYRTMFSASSYAPKGYRDWLGKKVRPLLRAHGLDRGMTDDVTGSPRTRSLAGSREGTALQLIGAELPIVGQPTLF
ncbi:MAG: radical SAM protein [Actinomycetota bacterium]